MLLDATATQLYSTVKAQTQAVSAQVDQAIQAKIAANGNVPLTAKQLEEVLCQAMPSHAQQIQQASSGCATHQCDGKNGKFVSTVATLMIEKERNGVYQKPQVPPAPRRDPLIAEVLIGKDVDFLVIANAGVFDSGKKPLAIKVLARERADLSKLDSVLKDFHTTWGATPDIVKVANDAAYFKLQDEQEHEFQFGHGIAAVSFDAKGGEMGRNGKIQPQNKLVTHLFHPKVENGQLVPDLTKPVGAPQVTQGPQLDQTQVQAYQDAIELKIGLNANAPKGAWLDTKLQFVSAELNVGQGYILEPGGSSTVQLYNTQVSGSVAADDFSFEGSKPGKANVALATWHAHTLANLLNQNVVETTRSVNGSDQRSTNTPAKNFIFRNAEHVQVGSAQLVPLQDRVLTGEQIKEAGIRAQIQPLPGDAQNDGFCVSLALAQGFATGKKPASLEGWTIEVGYSSPSGWVEAGSRKIDGSSVSGKENFILAVDNPTEAIASNRNLEVRLRNADGLPATRILVPFKELKWGN